MLKEAKQARRYPHSPLLTALGFGALSAVLPAISEALLESNPSSVPAEIILILIWVAGVCVWGVLFVRMVKVFFFPFRGLKTVWKEKRSLWAVLTEPVIESDWGRLADKISNWRAKRRVEGVSGPPKGVPMFCTSCGVKNPDEAQFCYRCGKPVYRESIPETPSSPTEVRSAAANLGVKEAPSIHTQSAPPHTPTAVPPANKKGGRRSYPWLTIEIAIYSLLFPIAAFIIVWQSIAGEAGNASRSIGPSILFMIFGGYAVKRAWASLLKIEPETNIVFKRKHKRFQATLGTSVVVLLTVAVAFGVVVGNRAGRNKRLETLRTQAAQLAPKNAEFRQRLGAILVEKPRSMGDYYDQCLRLQSLLNEFEPQRQKQAALQSTLFAEYQDDPKNRPSIALLRGIFEKDSQIITALRKEIEKAKELVSLPYYEQMTFYEGDIVPIKAEIERLSTEEMTLFRQAQAKGLGLPSDISELLKQP